MSEYNTDSVDGIYLPEADFLELQAAGPGAFCYTYDDERRVIGMIHVLPGAGFGHIGIRPHQQGQGDSWEWDGNLEKPTLHPSIHALPIEAKGEYRGRIGWHGWLKAGRFESC